MDLSGFEDDIQTHLNSILSEYHKSNPSSAPLKNRIEIEEDEDEDEDVVIDSSSQQQQQSFISDSQEEEMKNDVMDYCQSLNEDMAMNLWMSETRPHDLSASRHQLIKNWEAEAKIMSKDDILAKITMTNLFSPDAIECQNPRDTACSLVGLAIDLYSIFHSRWTTYMDAEFTKMIYFEEEESDAVDKIDERYASFCSNLVSSIFTFKEQLFPGATQESQLQFESFMKFIRKKVDMFRIVILSIRTMRNSFMKFDNIHEFDFVPDNNVDEKKQTKMYKIIKKLGERNAFLNRAHSCGLVYKRHKNSCWKFESDMDRFVKNATTNVDEALLNLIVSTPDDQIVKSLNEYRQTDFPEIVFNKSLIAFKNGIFHVQTCYFYFFDSADVNPPNNMDSSIIQYVRNKKMVNSIHGLREVTQNTDCNVYHDQHFDYWQFLREAWNPTLNRLDTFTFPCDDSEQFWRDQREGDIAENEILLELHFLNALLGRRMQDPADKIYDKFQEFLVLMGQPATGKSALLHLLHYAVGHPQSGRVADFPQNPESSFQTGNWDSNKQTLLTGSDLVGRCAMSHMINDISDRGLNQRSKKGGVASQQDLLFFLSIATNDMLFGSQPGIRRRMMLFFFKKKVDKHDFNMPVRVCANIGRFIFNCCLAYKELMDKVRSTPGKGLMSDWMPKTLKTMKQNILSMQSPVGFFYEKCISTKNANGMSISVEDMNAGFAAFKEKMGIHTTVTSETLCSKLGSIHFLFRGNNGYDGVKWTQFAIDNGIASN